LMPGHVPHRLPADGHRRQRVGEDQRIGMRWSARPAAAPPRPPPSGRRQRPRDAPAGSRSRSWTARRRRELHRAPNRPGLLRWRHCVASAPC
jgi:hypothetical protein